MFSHFPFDCIVIWWSIKMKYWNFQFSKWTFFAFKSNFQCFVCCYRCIHQWCIFTKYNFIHLNFAPTFPLINFNEFFHYRRIIIRWLFNIAALCDLITQIWLRYQFWWCWCWCWCFKYLDRISTWIVWFIFSNLKWWTEFIGGRIAETFQ